MIGEELKAIRERLALSQAALADEVGADANTVARWERGESRVPKAVAKLVQIMAGAIKSSTVTTAIGVARDPHHSAILSALNGHLDPEVFEACAADLLREVYPSLSPVRGGSDQGFD